jgi:hypothetical protein
LPDLSQGFSPPEAKMERSRNPGKGSTYLRTAINPVCAFAVGLMGIEKYSSSQIR